MWFFNPSQLYIEIRRSLQILNALINLGYYRFLLRLYRPNGLTKRTLMRRVFAYSVRMLLGFDVPDVTFQQKLRETLEYLGPTFVKLGQILSLREDMLPRRITEELKKLQTQVPPFSFKQVKSIIESDLNRPLHIMFDKFEEEPIASASLAQAHLAYLKGGTKVAVKVQRPGIVVLILNDLNILRRIATIVEKLPLMKNYRPTNLVREFADFTMRELDFVQEGKNADIFRINFKDEPRLIIPEIHWRFTSRRVLTMEYIDGIKPVRYEKLKSIGINGKSLAQLGARFIVKMLYVDGFFHGDPHPGNLLIVGRDRLALLDMGMIGSFSPKTMKYLFLNFYYQVAGEYEVATDYLLKLCTLGKRADIEGFKREISLISREWSGSGFMSFSLGRLILRSMSLGAKYDLYFSSDVLLGVKAVVTIEAVGHMLYPEMVLSDMAGPLMSEIFLNKFSPVELIKPIMRSMPEYMDMLVTLPKDLMNSMVKLSEGKFTIELESENDEDEEIILQSESNRKSGLWASVLIIGGVLLTVSEVALGPMVRDIPFVGSVPALALLIFSLATVFGIKAIKNKRGIHEN